MSFTHYADEMLQLKDTLLAMTSYVEAAVTRAMRSLVAHDAALAAQVLADDGQIDRCEIETDELAISLLAKAPLATDLRFVTVAMKISHNLERMGDEAVSIARCARELSHEPRLKPYIDLPRMATLCLAMLNDTLAAFVERQPARARAVVPRDAEIDELNRQLHRELASFMLERPGNISRCLKLMTISKALERIGDHVTNIAEEVVYLCEARDIRHT